MSDYEGRIRSWIEQVIVGHNFCPFAKNELGEERVRFSVCGECDKEKILNTVIDECQFLDLNPDTETTLIIFSKGLRNFDQFLNLVELADELMSLQGYEGVYQLATFHPDYCFAGLDVSDAANFTNRSPYPVLHLIREQSLEQALQNYPEPELIPENNIRLAREKGAGYFQNLLITLKKQ